MNQTDCGQSDWCPCCKAEGHPEHFGSPRGCAFRSGTFSPDNWNCETMNALRELADEDGHSWRDDMAAASFGFVWCGERADDPCGFYIAMSWYKNRGTTGRAVVMRDDEEPHDLTLIEAEAAIEFHAANRAS